MQQDVRLHSRHSPWRGIQRFQFVGQCQQIIADAGLFLAYGRDEAQAAFQGGGGSLDNAWLIADAESVGIHLDEPGGALAPAVECGERNVVALGDECNLQVGIAHQFIGEDAQRTGVLRRADADVVAAEQGEAVADKGLGGQPTLHFLQLEDIDKRLVPSGVPIFHTTTGYVGKERWALPRWDEKIPMSTLDINSDWMEIDPKLKPRPEEPVIHKKYASNFFGTHLAQTLNYLGVDTLIVMGATACACVRHTVMDSTGYGFKTIVPEGTVGDRVPGVIEWNLFDMEAKFCDVVPVDEVVKYLEGIDNSVYTKHARKYDK